MLISTEILVEGNARTVFEARNDRIQDISTPTTQ